MITPDQAAELLAVAALYDNRRVTAPAATAWAQSLDHWNVDFDDCVAAIHRHFAESTDYLMPKHVGELATRIRRERNYAAFQASEAERHALPEDYRRQLEGRTEATRQSRNIAALIEQFARNPDGTRKWSVIGDPDMRRRQSFPLSPEAEEERERESRAKALRIAKEGRDSRYEQQPEPPGIEADLAAAAEIHRTEQELLSRQESDTPSGIAEGTQSE